MILQRMNFLRAAGGLQMRGQVGSSIRGKPFSNTSFKRGASGMGDGPRNPGQILRPLGLVGIIGGILAVGVLWYREPFYGGEHGKSQGEKWKAERLAHEKEEGFVVHAETEAERLKERAYEKAKRGK